MNKPIEQWNPFQCQSLFYYSVMVSVMLQKINHTVPICGILHLLFSENDLKKRVYKMVNKLIDQSIHSQGQSLKSW